ncbi:hypothetical protein [Luteimonas chenhongjianii]|uniref:hypothetical protein n=1 Tax=Luteimonas chenhongjianii TaxID=2006110 RepID=UPI0012FDEA45|nr:hypothetical protein [Luteimonas chenhongjianii]
MNFQPLTVVVTLLAGLLLAGILGWIRKPRLVVLVPRLFSHSRISDKGQIAEISVMNRGFKTEESIELVLNPSLHYELVGSSSPDADLQKNKLLIPRIGSSDDCSVLLQVENGRFSEQEIVSCLSKETRASITSKLEEVPLTAQQRVAGITLFCITVGIFGGFFLWLDHRKNSRAAEVAKEASRAIRATEDAAGIATQAPPDQQGWHISAIYSNHDLYRMLTTGQIKLEAQNSRVERGVVRIPVLVENRSQKPISVDLSVHGTLPQGELKLDRRRIYDRLLLPNDSLEAALEALVPEELARQTVVVEFFLKTSDGDSLKGSRVVAQQ